MFPTLPGSHRYLDSFLVPSQRKSLPRVSTLQIALIQTLVELVFIWSSYYFQYTSTIGGPFPFQIYHCYSKLQSTMHSLQTLLFICLSLPTVIIAHAGRLDIQHSIYARESASKATHSPPMFPGGEYLVRREVGGSFSDICWSSTNRFIQGRCVDTSQGECFVSRIHSCYNRRCTTSVHIPCYCQISQPR